MQGERWGLELGCVHGIWGGGPGPGKEFRNKERAGSLRKKCRVRDGSTQNLGTDAGLGEGLGSQGETQNL